MNLDNFRDRLKAWFAGAADPETSDKLLYTVALALCLAFDVFNRGNKKGSATYFERLMGHLFCWALHSSPTKRIKLDKPTQ